MSVGELGETLRSVIGTLPFAALHQATDGLDAARMTLTQCAEGSSTGELPEAITELDQAQQQAVAASQHCTQLREALERYIQAIGATGSADGSASGAAGTHRVPSAGGAAPPPDPALIAEVQANGHKISPDRVVRIGRGSDGKVVWMEKGNATAGEAHLMGSQRVADFKGIGIAASDIVDVVFTAATKGTPVGISGRDRVVYAVDHHGEQKRIAVSVSSNGFIVGGHPIPPDRKVKPLP